MLAISGICAPGCEGRPVRDELVEEFATAVENALLMAGAPSFEAGFEQFYCSLKALADRCELLKTRDRLETVLRALPDPDPLEENMFRATLSNLPRVVASFLQISAVAAQQEFARPDPGRRSSLSLKQQRAVCQNIGALHAAGVSLAVAKQRTARKFGVSVRTVTRAWAERKQLHTKEPRVKEILDYLQEN